MTWLPESPINNLEGGAFTKRKPLNEPIRPITMKVFTSSKELVKKKLNASKNRNIFIVILAVIPSILSNIFKEFMSPTTQIKVIMLSIQNTSVIEIIILLAIRLKPQSHCVANLISGLVLNASSASPIKNASDAPKKKNRKRRSPKMFCVGCEME